MAFILLQRWISLYVSLIATTFNSGIPWYSYSPSPCSAKISAGALTFLQSAHSSTIREVEYHYPPTPDNRFRIRIFLQDYWNRTGKEDIFDKLVCKIQIFSVQRMYSSLITKPSLRMRGREHVWRGVGDCWLEGKILCCCWYKLNTSAQ